MKTKAQILEAKDWNEEYPDYMHERDILDAMDEFASEQNQALIIALDYQKKINDDFRGVIEKINSLGECLANQKEMIFNIRDATEYLALGLSANSIKDQLDAFQSIVMWAILYNIKFIKFQNQNEK